jgi:hypothetical protein
VESRRRDRIAAIAERNRGRAANPTVPVAERLDERLSRHGSPGAPEIPRGLLAKPPVAARILEKPRQRRDRPRVPVEVVGELARGAQLRREVPFLELFEHLVDRAVVPDLADEPSPFVERDAARPAGCGKRHFRLPSGELDAVRLRPGLVGDLDVDREAEFVFEGQVGLDLRTVRSICRRSGTHW